MRDGQGIARRLGIAALVLAATVALAGAPSAMAQHRDRHVETYPPAGSVEVFPPGAPPPPMGGPSFGTAMGPEVGMGARGVWCTSTPEGLVTCSKGGMGIATGGGGYVVRR